MNNKIRCRVYCLCYGQLCDVTFISLSKSLSYFCGICGSKALLDTGLVSFLSVSLSVTSYQSLLLRTPLMSCENIIAKQQSLISRVFYYRSLRLRHCFTTLAFTLKGSYYDSSLISKQCMLDTDKMLIEY